MERRLRLLGFAQKAGKVVSGQLACEGAIKKRKAHLVLIAIDAAAETKERIIGLCSKQAVPYRIWGLKDQLGQVLGKPPRAVVAILDRHFAAQLHGLMEP